MLHSALNVRMYILCTGLLSWFDRGRAKWWWSILAEAIMKHRVFPGSRWDVLLGNIPRDRGWRTGLMRKQSSQLRIGNNQRSASEVPNRRILIWSGWWNLCNLLFLISCLYIFELPQKNFLHECWINGYQTLLSAGFSLKVHYVVFGEAICWLNFAPK